MKNAFIIFSLLLGHALLAQSLSFKSLIQRFELKENTTFLINGQAYGIIDSAAVDHKLKGLNQKLIIGITSVKNEGKVGDRHSDVIRIDYAVALPRQMITAKFAELKNLFKDEYHGFSQHIFAHAKDPVLYVDNHKVHHAEVTKVLARLNENEIAYINIDPAQQRQEYHGQNATNGVVVIWTEEQLKKASR